MPNVSGTPPPSSMHQHNTQHKTVPQHNYIKNRDYPYNEDTNARNVASSASTIREGNTPTRDSIPVHDGTHLKVSILREKNKPMAKNFCMETCSQTGQRRLHNAVTETNADNGYLKG